MILACAAHTPGDHTNQLVSVSVSIFPDERTSTVTLTRVLILTNLHNSYSILCFVSSYQSKSAHHPACDPVCWVFVFLSAFLHGQHLQVHFQKLMERTIQILCYYPETTFPPSLIVVHPPQVLPSPPQ